jgi:hypothetical protein
MASYELNERQSRRLCSRNVESPLDLHCQKVFVWQQLQCFNKSDRLIELLPCTLAQCARILYFMTARRLERILALAMAGVSGAK